MKDYVNNKYTPSEVAKEIMFGLSNWLEPLEDSTTCIQVKEKSLISAIKQQNNIGWDHFVRGRIAIEWGALINRQLKEKKIPSEEMDAETWGAKMISINWKYVLEMWKLRNDEEHGTDAETIEKKKKERLMAEILHLQEENMDINIGDANWLLEDADILMENDSNRLEIWLYGARILGQINQKERKVRKRNRQKMFNSNTIPDQENITPEFDPGESGNIISDLSVAGSNCDSHLQPFAAN
jgi:hypothetical protein